MLKFIDEQLSNQDIFGHEINLQFRKKGNVHKTWIGGCFSLCVKIVIIGYISYLLIKMFTYGDDKIQVSSYNV